MNFRWASKPPAGTPINHAHEQMNGLVGWWLFQEGAGNKINDLSVNNNPCTLNDVAFPPTAASGWNPGRTGKSVRFDNSYGNIGDKELTNTDITITAWIQADALATNALMVIVSKYNAGGDQSYYLATFDAGGDDTHQVRGFIQDSGADSLSFNSNTDLVAGRQYHVAMTFDSGTGTIKLYLDGVLDGTQTDPTVGDIDSNVAPILIGSRVGGTERYFDGLIDDVRIYNRVLTESEIRSVMNEPFAAFQHPLEFAVLGSAAVRPPFDLDASPFPAVVNSTDFDLIMYNRITNLITDLTAQLGGISDQDGNISLGGSKTIGWGGVPQISWSDPKVQVKRLEIPSPWSYTALTVGGDVTVSNDATVTNTLTLAGNLSVAGAIETNFVTDTTITIAQIAEPDDPPDEHSVMWLSNGTGIGDVGDLMLKIQHGSVVKSTTLIDFV